MQEQRTREYQLSPQQRRLWALGGDGASPYVAQCTVLLRGSVDTRLLEDAFADVCARHEALRTLFEMRPGDAGPRQIVEAAPRTTSRLEFHDFSRLSERERREAIARLPQDVSPASSVPGRSPLQAALVSLGGGDGLIHVSIPSRLCDAGGLTGLVADLARCYEARAHRTNPPEPALQYGDVAGWLNDALTSPESAAGRDFWGRQPLSAVPNRRLPFDLPDAGRPFQPRRIPLFATGAVAAGAVAAGAAAAEGSWLHEAGLDLDGFLLACWQCVLQRLADTTDLLVGCTADGRQHAELQDVVGLLARHVPFTGRVASGRTFRELVQQLQAARADALAWSDCFDCSSIDGLESPGSAPVISPFVFESRPPCPVYAAAGVTFQIDAVDAYVDRFRLRFVRSGLGAAQSLSLDYDASVYREEDVRALASALESVIADAARQPDAPVAELRLISEPDARRLLAAAPEVRVPDAPDVCIHRLFERQAGEQPDRVAVVYEDEHLTYGELDSRATRLAAYLQSLGVGPERLVGVCLERSVDIPVAILGTLKAGGAYVPLDPALPAERLDAILAECRPALVITVDAVASRLPGGQRLVLLDREPPAAEGQPAALAQDPATPANLVYVLFTSGSTGRPKGVAVEHRQLAAYVAAVLSRLDLPPASSYAMVTTYAGDVSHTAFYPALLSGARLHILSESRASDPRAFGDYMQRHAVDVLKTVPSHLRALLSGPAPERVLPRKRLVLGGEACRWDLVDTVHALMPSCTVFNSYGPTETTVAATMYRVAAGDSRPPTASVPIGRAFPHVAARVLDERGRPAAPWIPGELYIGGAGVARGYVNGRESTTSGFVPDTFSPIDGARQYRTGDRARMLPSGDFEFLGRRDHQVKIRGYRVELGDVEAALRRHALVREAAVVVREGRGPDETRLVAFVSGTNGSRPEPGGLRGFLRELLPEYMVPAALIPLDAIPLTPNGKIDRAALSEMPDAPHDTPAPGEGPGSPWEQTIAEIWRDLLQVDEVGAHDNFYDLGGHSLLAMQVVAAVEQRTGVHVSPRSLVLHTLRQFSAMCESRAATAAL